MTLFWTAEAVFAIVPEIYKPSGETARSATFTSSGVIRTWTTRKDSTRQPSVSILETSFNILGNGQFLRALDANLGYFLSSRG